MPFVEWESLPQFYFRPLIQLNNKKPDLSARSQNQGLIETHVPQVLGLGVLMHHPMPVENCANISCIWPNKPVQEGLPNGPPGSTQRNDIEKNVILTMTDTFLTHLSERQQ